MGIDLLWPTLMAQTLRVFDCSVVVEGVPYVASDMKVACDTTQYAIILVIACLMLCLLLGFPLLLMALLCRQKHLLDDFFVRSRFFFLYGEFKEQYFYWEIVVRTLEIDVDCGTDIEIDVDCGTVT